MHAAVLSFSIKIKIKIVALLLIYAGMYDKIRKNRTVFHNCLGR